MLFFFVSICYTNKKRLSNVQRNGEVVYMSKKVKLILIVTVIILGIILICLGVIRVVRNSNNENTN